MRVALKFDIDKERVLILLCSALDDCADLDNMGVVEVCIGLRASDEILGEMSPSGKISVAQLLHEAVRRQKLKRSL